MEQTIYAHVNVQAIGPGYTDDPGDARGKPYLQLSFPQGPIIYVTAHLADMIGGIGRGASARWKDLQEHNGEES